jgi:hypothetical protein
MSVIPEYGLTGEQLDLLMRPLNGNRVQEHKGQAHLEAWDVRRWLTRVFGFTGWKDEILSLDLVHESVWPWTDGNGKPVPGKNRASVVYRVTLRLTVKDVHGREINSWEDVATGEAINQASVGDAHDLAVKAAVSQALKRCAVNLGDQFGLSLYNDGGIAPVIVRTVGHPNVPKPGAEQPAVEDAPVVGGELAEQAAAEDAPAPAQPALQPDPAPADVPMISDGQRKAVFAMLNRKHGKVSDEVRYQGLSKFAGRTVTSLNEYTYDEAARLLEALAKQPDLKPASAPAEVDENENFRQAEKLAQLEQPNPAEQLEEDLRDAIESSDNRFELAGAMKAATDARDAGKLTPEQYARLTEAANLRTRRGSRQLAGAAA